MQRHVIHGAFFFLLQGVASTFAADQPKPIEGTADIGARSYKLTHVVAYETKYGDEPAIAVLASDRTIPLDRIRAVLRENDGNDERLFLDQPHVRVLFDAAGKTVDGKAWADNSMFSTNGEALTGELKKDGGRVRGSARLALPARKDFKQTFELRFDTVLGLDPPVKSATTPPAPVKPSVTGTYKGNGKPAKLAFVSAQRGEVFNDKPSIVLVFSEKDHSKEKRPDIKAAFGDFGSALILSLHDNGAIFGCVIAHAGLARQGVNSLGNIRSAPFESGNGKVEGRITTDGAQKVFDETWEVDIKFVAPFNPPETKPATAKAAETKSESKPSPSAAGTKPAPTPGAKPAEPAAAINVHDLPFPKDATDMEYRELVEQIVFKSATGVQPLAADLVKKLAAQGWKGTGADLITAQSAILMRTRGEATLTIMVKPSGKGSEVTVFADGLEWDKKDK